MEEHLWGNSKTFEQKQMIGELTQGPISHVRAERERERIAYTYQRSKHWEFMEK